MRRIVLLTAAIIVWIAAAAQEPVDTASLRRRVFTAKLNELTTQLDLTPEQRRSLVPIYRDYSADMRALLGNKPQRGAAPATTAEATEALRLRYARQKQVIDLRIKYIDRLATILTPEQLWRFFDVENSIQRRINERKHEKHDAKTNYSHSATRKHRSGYHRKRDERYSRGHRGMPPRRPIPIINTYSQPTTQ